MESRKIITNSELVNLIKVNSRKKIGEEGAFDYDVFVGFNDGSYEGLEVDTSYHIMVSNNFLYSSRITDFLRSIEKRAPDIKDENAIHYISDYFIDGNIFELEDIDRVFDEYTVKEDNFIVVHSHLELLQTMYDKPGQSIVVEWSR